METITANMYDSRQVTADHSSNLKESADQHREIFRAIRTHSPAQARSCMEQHLNAARTAQAIEEAVPKSVAAG